MSFPLDPSIGTVRSLVAVRIESEEKILEFALWGRFDRHWYPFLFSGSVVCRIAVKFDCRYSMILAE